MAKFFSKYINLIIRVLVTIGVLIGVVVSYDSFKVVLSKDYGFSPIYLLWLVFTLGIISRLLPLKNIGTAKIFARNYKKVNTNISIREDIKRDDIRAIIMLSLGLLYTFVMGILYYTYIIDSVIILLTVLILWTLSEVCVSIFCPFSYLFLEKICCNKCRFYSWDYMLILTPLVFIGRIDIYIVVLLAIMLAIIWEIVYRLHPYRFYDKTNENLKCSNCKNKNCENKTFFNNIADKILFKDNNTTDQNP